MAGVQVSSYDLRVHSLHLENLSKKTPTPGVTVRFVFILKQF